MFREELVVRFAVRVYRESLSVCVCASIPFGFEYRMWDLIAQVLDRYLSFYLSKCGFCWPFTRLKLALIKMLRYGIYIRSPNFYIFTV